MIFRCYFDTIYLFIYLVIVMRGFFAKKKIFRVLKAFQAIVNIFKFL